MSSHAAIQLSVFTRLTTLSEPVDDGFGKSKHVAVRTIDVKL